MTTPLHRAAAKWCAAKAKEKRLRKSLLRCDRVAYFVSYDMRRDEAVFTPQAEPKQDTFCSRVVVGDESLPAEQWCESCRANLPAVVELRKLRRSFGGLTMMMNAAWRKAAREGK